MTRYTNILAIIINEHKGKGDEESKKQEPYRLPTSRNNLPSNRKSFIKFKTFVN